jgi:hypothetical protein
MTAVADIQWSASLLRKETAMFPIKYDPFLKFAVAGAFTVLAAVCGPAGAGDQAQNLGPVGPNEPILTTVGGKRVIAFYLSGSGRCAVHAVMWDNENVSTDLSAVRVRVSLGPGQIIHIDTPVQESLDLECGKNAEKLAIVDTNRAVALGLTSKQPTESVKASAVGF